MTEYKVAGEIIIIPTAVENYRQYTLIMNPYLDSVKDKFNKWYSKQGSIEQVEENAVDILLECWDPIVEEVLKLYKAQNVFTVDERMIADECYHECARSFFEIIEEAMDKIYDIDDARDEAKEYRKMRKDNRSRMVGIGFGVRGTAKSMVKAGAFNMATGTAHSLANAVGNMGSAIAASAEKSSIYYDSKKTLRNATYEATQKIINMLRQKLSQRTDFEFKFVTVDEANKAKAIIKNYKEDCIPVEKRKDNILLALQLNPYKEETYKIIWNEYGDISGDLMQMANYFGVPLEKYIYDIAIAECNEIFNKYCSEYTKAANKISAGIKLEENLKKAYELICQYISEHNLQKTKISQIAVCEEAFALIDEELKDVDGVGFESREEAAKVRTDKKIFYEYLKNNNNLGCEEVKKNVKLLEFESAYYRDNCDAFIEDEIERRDPTKFYNQIEKVIFKYFTPEEEVFEVNYVNDIKQKEVYIRRITGMPQGEKIIALFDESTTGKKGVLISNIFLRIFEKGKILGENIYIPINCIQNISCLGNSKYWVEKTEDGREFNIKEGYDLCFQNKLCKCLNELIFIINNLSEEERTKLQYFSPKSIRCECGELMAENNNICTKCRKKYLGEGKFAETISCPSCGKRIVKGKKFCGYCGEQIPDDFEEKESQKVKYCKKCGCKLKQTQKFCNQCGAKI